MKAILFEQFGGPIAVTDVADPEVPDDGVVVRVRATGLCRSDWHAWQGHDPGVRLPHVPGHELAGTIETVGRDVRRWRVGDRVTVPFVSGCGSCAICASGDPQVCPSQYQPGFSGWGSFAEWVALRFADGNLVALPADLGYVEAASLGCRFVTAYRAVAALARVQEGEWVAVHGCGGVGLAAVMIAAARGARIVAVDRREAALKLAREFGAEVVVDAGRTSDVSGAIQDLTHGGAAVSIDALGSPSTCRNSILSLRPRGRHVQVGLLLADEANPPVPMADVIAKELQVFGCHGMAAHAYPGMLEEVASGRLRPGRLVRRTLALSEVPAALEGMGRFAESGVSVVDRF
ncbi:MAG: zinc-dependent alcohol dehydrogenase family protein [Limisphaerales bacterium]